MTFQFKLSVTERAIYLFRICVFIGGTLISTIGIAQVDSVDLKYYFDDKGISQGIMIKTDIISIVHGDFPVLVEGKLRNNVTLEGGPGIILPYYIHDFLALAFTDNEGISNNRFGYSLRLHLKWYGKASDRDYWGLQFYRREFNTITINEWFFTMGDQRIIGKRLLLDISLGLGVRFQNAKENNYMFDPDFSFIPIFPLMIRFGYIAKRD